MAADEKWYFTKEQIQCAPSRKYGYDVDKELSCRQQAANFIQDMGQRLQVTQLCINTAIVYMHRFYMFHSFSRFHRNNIAAAALFLAAKVEEQPRKLEHVIKVSQICLHRDVAPPDVKSETYMEQAQELVVNENILLQTLGFDVGIDHPHTHVVRCCQLVRASKDLAQTSYFMASNSLHLTTMCLQYKPTVVACFCIHLACKWSNWEIPQSTEGKPWFWYIDKSVTQELLEQLTEEFLAIFEKCPSRLKKKITSISQNQNLTILSQFNSNKDDKKRNGLFPTGCSLSTAEEMKKKQEFQRHHPEYKKHHMSTSSHHNRPEAASVTSKSSCMFGPPQRTQSSSHSSISSSHQSRSISKSAAPDGSSLGKPEHLHHRPRRPEEKHPRNHDHIPAPYKKYDKVPSGAVNEFPQPGSTLNSRGGMYNTTTPSSYQLAQQMAPQAMHPPAPPEQNPIPPQPPTPKIAPIPPRVKTPPPPVVKIERSIFSPEKCTPPPENLIKPLPPTPPPVAPAPNFFHKMTIKEEPVVKLEPIAPLEVKQEISISPKEEKPPDLIVPVEQPVPVEVPTIAPVQTQPEEHTSHKEKKHKKEKKKHKEHKEKHKDKHKHKHKNRDSEPTQQRAGDGLSLVIKIPKEQITLTSQPEPLKIKIPKDKITTPKMPVESPLKIKISQGKIKESKKRDRSEERSPGLPAKYHRPNGTTTLQVKDNKLVDFTNIKQEFSVEALSPPSVQFDHQDLGGNLVHSPPSINFDADLVKQEFEVNSPPSIVHSPPSIVHSPPSINILLDFDSQVVSPPPVNLDHGYSSPLPDLESELEVIRSLSPINVKQESRPPSVNEKRDSRPPSVNEKRESRPPSVNEKRESRPPSVNEWESRAPSVNEKRDSRPPSVNEKRESRPSSGNEKRESRPPSVNEKRESRPPSVNEKRDSRPPSVNEKRDNRPPSVNDKWDSRPPSVNEKRDSHPPSVNEKRDSRPPSVNEKRDSRPPSVNEKRTVDGVTVEVHSPPSISFDDMDTGEDMMDSSSPPLKGSQPDLTLRTEFSGKKSPWEEINKVVKQEIVEEDRRSYGSYNQWNRYSSDEYKPNFSARGGILYRDRGRGRGAYRPPRGGNFYREFPSRPQWAPRPEGFRGGFRPGYNPQPRSAIRHQFQHQARPPRISYPQHYEPPNASQHPPYPDHPNITQLYADQQQHHFAEQQHHFAQMQQHYYQTQQALYASQFAQPPPPSSNKNPPPLPDGPPPDIPPPPPPPE